MAEPPRRGVDSAPPAPMPAPAPAGGPPRYSIVIPIHNEAECLADEVAELVGEMDARGVDYELLLAENGSSDDTPAIAEALAAANPRIRALRVPVPDYGAAMKTGMLTGRGDFIVNFDIDFHDVDFMLEAGDLLAGAGPARRRRPARPVRRRGGQQADAGRGRPALAGPAHDLAGVHHHPAPALRPRMDDTHGMKVLRRDVVQRFAPQTVMTRDLFDTELIIRARRGGVTVKALPVTVEEKRKPRSSIVRRIPRTMKGLLRLRLVLWKEGNAGS